MVIRIPRLPEWGVALTALTLTGGSSAVAYEDDASADAAPTHLKISMALQDNWSSAKLGSLGVSNDAWSMSGDAVGPIGDPRLPYEERVAARGENLRIFIAMPESKIRNWMKVYLNGHPTLSRETTRTIIIDIETPTQPREFWKLLEGENHDRITHTFTEVVKAFSRRYAVIRETFPNATLTVFSMGSPTATGLDSDASRAGLNAELLAVKMGMLEAVDAISPELYERYGPGDPMYPHVNRATYQSLRDSLRIVQAAGEATGRSLDIIPMLSLTVFNAPGHSILAGKPADVGGLAEIREMQRTRAEAAPVPEPDAVPPEAASP